MKRNLAMAWLLTCHVVTGSAFADVLYQSTLEAKLALENSQKLSAITELKKKATGDALSAFSKPFKDFGPVQDPAANPALLPWCDAGCVEAYNGLKQSDGKIDPKKLPVPTVPADQTVLATLNSEVKKAAVAEVNPAVAEGDQAGTNLSKLVKLVARVDKATPLTATQKALLVAGCYRPPASGVTVENCQKNVEVLANDAKATARSAENIGLIDKLGKLPDITVATRALSFCGAECLAAYESFISPMDKSLELAKLPSKEVCAAAIKKNGLSAATSVQELPTTVNFTGVGIEEQKALVLAVCPGNLSPPYGTSCTSRLTSLANNFDRVTEKSLREAAEAADAEAAVAKKNEMRDFEIYQKAKQAQTVAGDEPAKSISDRLAGVRRARCATAYCWGGSDGRKYAVEPILDLPIGMYWSAGGGALAQYVNANNIKVHVTAGLRYWFAYDVMSLGVLLAQPELTDAQTTVDYRDKALPSSQVRRPYPTLVVGVWGDIIQLSVSYDELRNSSRTSGNYIQEYPANAALSRAATFGIAINPLTAARNGIGAAVGSTEAGK